MDFQRQRSLDLSPTPAAAAATTVAAVVDSVATNRKCSRQQDGVNTSFRFRADGSQTTFYKKESSPSSLLTRPIIIIARGGDGGVGRPSHSHDYYNVVHPISRRVYLDRVDIPDNKITDKISELSCDGDSSDAGAYEIVPADVYWSRERRSADDTEEIVRRGSTVDSSDF